MWPKFLISFFVGLLLSISLSLNLNLLLPLGVDTRLLVGLLLAFVFWMLSMIYCLSRNNAKAALLGCIKLLVPSSLLNVALILGVAA